MDLSSRSVGAPRPVMPTWTPSLKMRFASITSDGGALPAITRTSQRSAATAVVDEAVSTSALSTLQRKNARLRDELTTATRQRDAARDGKRRARDQVERMQEDMLDAKTVILTQQRALAELKAKYHRVEGAMGALHREGVLGGAGSPGAAWAATSSSSSSSGVGGASTTTRSRDSSGTEHYKGALAVLSAENRKLKSRLQQQRRRERELERRIDQLEQDTRQRKAPVASGTTSEAIENTDPTLGAVSSAVASLMHDESSPLAGLEPALRIVAIETAMESFSAQQQLKVQNEGATVDADQNELVAQVKSGAFGLLIKLRKMLTAMQQLVTHQDDLSPAEVVRVMMRTLRVLVPSDQSAVWLVDRGRNQMWSIGALDFTYHVALDGGICGDVVASGEVTVVELAQVDPRFDPAIDDPTQMGESNEEGQGSDAEEASASTSAAGGENPASSKTSSAFSILAVPLGYVDGPMQHHPTQHGRHGHATSKGVIGVLELVRAVPDPSDEEEDEEEEEVKKKVSAWSATEVTLVSIFAQVAGPLLHHAQVAATTRRCVQMKCAAATFYALLVFCAPATSPSFPLSPLSPPSLSPLSLSFRNCSYSAGMEALLTMPHAAAEEAALLEAARLGARKSSPRYGKRSGLNPGSPEKSAAPEFTDNMVGVVKQMQVVLESALKVEGVRVFVIGDAVDSESNREMEASTDPDAEASVQKRMWWVEHELDDDGVNHIAMRRWANTSSALAGHVATTCDPLLLCVFLFYLSRLVFSSPCSALFVFSTTTAAHSLPPLSLSSFSPEPTRTMMCTSIQTSTWIRSFRPC